MQLQLPWEASESSSQLLTVFRGEVKKNWVLQKHLKCLVWKVNVKCVTPRVLFLSGQISPLSCSWYLDFPTRQVSRSSSNLPKTFHTHHIQKILAAFSQVSF